MSSAGCVMYRGGNNLEYSSGPDEVQQSWDQFTASRGERPKYGSTTHPTTPGTFLINTHSAQTHERYQELLYKYKRDKLGH